MNRIPIAWLILLFLHVLTQAAKADILFIDFNKSPAEVDAARSAARARHEKLVIFPDPTSEQKTMIARGEQIDRLRAPLSKKFYELNDELDITSDQVKVQEIEAQQKELQEKMSQLDREEHELSKGLTDLEINEANLTACIKKKINSGAIFETLIISGHQSGGYFGAQGRLDKVELASIISEIPEIKNSLKSIYGWGCYSATVEQGIFWKDNIPNLKMLAGYDGSAPAGVTQASSKVLQTVLARDFEIQHSRANAQSASYETLLSKLTGINETTFAGCTPKVCEGKNIGKVDLSQANKDCSSERKSILEEELLGIQNTVFCNTQHSDLRTYYEQSRKYEHCKYEKNFPERTIRQVFFKTVYANFKLYHSEEFAKLDLDMKSCKERLERLKRTIGCEPYDSEHSEGATTSFSDIFLQAGKIKRSACLSQESKDFADQILSLFVPGERVGKIDSACIPIDWIEPATSQKNLSAPSPQCLKKADTNGK